jgi:hypothetical protein
MIVERAITMQEAIQKRSQESSAKTGFQERNVIGLKKILYFKTN